MRAQRDEEGVVAFGGVASGEVAGAPAQDRDQAVGDRQHPGWMRVALIAFRLRSSEYRVKTPRGLGPAGRARLPSPAWGIGGFDQVLGTRKVIESAKFQVSESPG